MRQATNLPAVQITVDGGLLPPAAHTTLASVRVARRLSLPAQCEIGFAVRPGIDVSKAAPIGATIDVSVVGDTGRLFDGQVTAHEWVHGADGSAELRLRAYDGLHRLRKRQRVVGREAVTAGDLAGELAAEAGLGAKVEHDGPRWPVLVQHRQTDLELLHEVAERAGLWFVAVDGDLCLFSLEGFGDTVDLALHDTLLAARFDASADPACRSVTVTGWDPVSAGDLTGEAGSARRGHDATAEVGPDAVGADGERFLVDHPGPTADHLVATAQAELDRRVAREVTLTGTAEGDARLHPGRAVRVTGCHADVAGTYMLTETIHSVDGSGYLAELSSAPPPPPGPPPGAATTVGIVLSADDPDGLGRVRLALPGYGAVETDWREVLVPGAGAGKGIVAIPDVDDRVLVLLPNGDPGASIVLGGLYGADRPVDPGIDGGAVKRWSMLTPGGQRVILDDTKGSMVIANRDGSSVVLTPEHVTVHAAADLTIEAPGKTMTLRANRIDFLQATSPEDPPVPVHEGVA